MSQHYDLIIETKGIKNRERVFKKFKDSGYEWSSGRNIDPESDARVYRGARYITGTIENGIKIIRYGSSLVGLSWDKLIEYKDKKNNVERYGGVM